MAGIDMVCYFFDGITHKTRIMTRTPANKKKDIQQNIVLVAVAVVNVYTYSTALPAPTGDTKKSNYNTKETRVSLNRTLILKNICCCN